MAPKTSSRRKPPAPRTRREQARETRARICDAAQSLFAERGYAGTTMDAIARRAKVAVQTVYFSFRTKGSVFLEVILRMSSGQDQGVPVLQRPWFEAALQEKDPQRQLAMLVEHGHNIYARIAALWPHIAAAAAEDPDFAVRIQAIVDGRRRGMRSYLDSLAAKGALCVSAERAADTFFLIATPEALSLSTAYLGWSLERFKAWTWEQAVHVLKDSVPRPQAAAGLSFGKELSMDPR